MVEYSTSSFLGWAVRMQDSGKLLLSEKGEEVT
jgi:hypothetical protein